MANRKHNLRVVTSQETEAPKSIKEELDDIDSDLLLTISLLEVLQRAVNHSDDAELWASLRIAIGRFHEVQRRVDEAIIRIAHEGAPGTIRTVRS